jgi:ribosomal protein S6E (S10)
MLKEHERVGSLDDSFQIGWTLTIDGTRKKKEIRKQWTTDAVINITCVVKKHS